MSKQSKPKTRLTPKQKRFIADLFGRCCEFNQSMQMCNVSMRELDRWLAQPRFRDEIRRRVNQCRFMAHVETAISLPEAARALRETASGGHDHIRYAAGRDLFLSGLWIKKIPHPIPDEQPDTVPPFLAGTFKSLEKLLNDRTDDRKVPA